MKTIESDTSLDQDRRRLLGMAAMTVAASQLGVLTTARAAVPATISTADFPLTRQIDAGPLNIGYVEMGPAKGPAAILLHGWPYDIHAFVDVAPRLAKAGYRVIVPHLRGYGTTVFHSTDTMRNGQQAALAFDVIALMDALNIQRAVLAGFDWGARTADIVAALWPERCVGLVSVSGYLRKL